MRYPIIGGAIRTHEGLRYVPVNAKALGYGAAVIPASRAGRAQPDVVPKPDAAEFRKMTLSLDVYVRLPDDLPFLENPARARGFLRDHLRAADALAARAVLVPPIRRRVNGSAENLASVARKLYAVFEDLPEGPEVIFRAGPPGAIVSSPAFLSRVCRDLPTPWRFGMSLDPGEVTLDWDDRRIDEFARAWGPQVRALHLTSTREDSATFLGLIRRLSSAAVLLEHPSITEQNEVAEWLRCAFEDPDVFEVLNDPERSR